MGAVPSLSVGRIYFFASPHRSRHLVSCARSRLHSWHSIGSIRTDQTWRGCASPVTLSRRESSPIYISWCSFRIFFQHSTTPLVVFISARWYESQSMGNRDPYLIPNLYPVIEWAWKYAGATKFSLFCSELAVWKLLLITSCIPVWIPWRVELGRKPRSSVHETWICMVLINM